MKLAGGERHYGDSPRMDLKPVWSSCWQNFDPLAKQPDLAAMTVTAQGLARENTAASGDDRGGDVGSDQPGPRVNPLSAVEPV